METIGAGVEYLALAVRRLWQRNLGEECWTPHAGSPASQARCRVASEPVADSPAEEAPAAPLASGSRIEPRLGDEPALADEHPAQADIAARAGRQPGRSRCSNRQRRQPRAAGAGAGQRRRGHPPPPMPRRQACPQRNHPPYRPSHRAAAARPGCCCPVRLCHPIPCCRACRQTRPPTRTVDKTRVEQALLALGCRPPC